MMVSASEVKARGTALFARLLEKFDEVVIQVRGRPRYVVLDAERFERLRELELEAALREVNEDISAGRYEVVSAEEHLAWAERAAADVSHHSD